METAVNAIRSEVEERKPHKEQIKDAIQQSNRESNQANATSQKRREPQSERNNSITVEVLGLTSLRRHEPNLFASIAIPIKSPILLHDQLEEKDAEVALAQAEMKDQAALVDDLDQAMRDVAAVSASSRAAHFTPSSRHTSDGDSCILRRQEAWLATVYHNDGGLVGDKIWLIATAH
ncbi:hypothetical protein V498_04144 [Pseudogymnoascus sp. VKM F-4517 (FW-2822)]|nr:hypothetical protein V498_04144 [Pseudogymnoascus sp. VKM F-4517 (FW-2822)]